MCLVLGLFLIMLISYQRSLTDASLCLVEWRFMSLLKGGVESKSALRCRSISENEMWGLNLIS